MGKIFEKIILKTGSKMYSTLYNFSVAQKLCTFITHLRLKNDIWNIQITILISSYFYGHFHMANWYCCICYPYSFCDLRHNMHNFHLIIVPWQRNKQWVDNPIDFCAVFVCETVQYIYVTASAVQSSLGQWCEGNVSVPSENQRIPQMKCMP